jgi:hypothetical protein
VKKTKPSGMPLRKRSRSTKGALIKGVTGRLSAMILDSAAFTSHINRVMKGHSGIYLLYHRTTPYYVGKAHNLLGRLRAHQRGRHKDKWDGFAIWRIRNIRLLRDVETLLLQLLKPVGNKVAGRLPRKANINLLLQQALKDAQRELNVIRKAMTASKA